MAPEPYPERSLGMGYSSLKLPQAYCAKSAQGSAVVSINRSSRPGESVGVFSEAAGAGAVSAVHNAKKKTRTSAVRAAVRFVIRVSFKVYLLALRQKRGAGNSLLVCGKEA